ncbi:UvrD-helicase domain-containing protein [Propionicicella superfundia]|uniref:UvrD-helicase domain-containing protein n=1 Tax=Propionicicella superfundia TaxID=348582 RepID=UPI00042788E5|nr:UvrD-helicase domain-containing protein [Propionicicella superfundia]
MTSSLDLTGFDLTGDLPAGTLLLEASAGTGKTYTLASLAVRYLAEEDVTLRDLLLITFSRMATAELRSRVRARLTEAIAALSGPGRDGGAHLADPVLAHLCEGDPGQLALRLGRLRAAAADFDAATIATTHEFCQRMLFGLGVLADHDPAPRFVADPRALVAETTADVFVRRFADARAPFTYADAWNGRVPAQQFAAAVVREPAAVVAPDDAAGVAGERVDFAREVRGDVERRKLRRRLFTYDDQLIRLRDALCDPVTGPAARSRLAERFRVVLVDEFQDTDPIQWEILSRTFHGHSTLVLIGDPKQAIYGFRGADVGTYQSAAAVADRRAALTTNHRSDAALVAAVDQLVGGAELGAGIVVPPATSAHPARRIAAASPGLARPLRIRGVPPQHRELDRRTANAIIVNDLVAEVAGLLTQDVRLTLDGRQRALRPGDIAVLVRTNAMGKRIGTALREAGIAAAVAGSDSLFESDAAREWLQLLRALAEPRSRRVRTAALTPFLGWTLQELAEADDLRLAALRETVHAWSRVWEAHGTAALWEAVTARPAFAAGARARPDGDRLLTDLRQVAQELELAESRGVRPAGLVDWLVDQMAERPDTRRFLARDDEAVHVLTIHRSKGLEFPLVLLPDLAIRTRLPRGDETIVFHDEAHRRCVDVGGGGAPGRSARMTAWREEADAETLRDLYVAVTRAQVGVVAWWVPEKTTRESPLHRLLARPPGTMRPARSYDLDDLRVRPDRPAVTFETISPAEPRVAPRLAPAAADSEGLRVRSFDRSIDLAWRRTSYSGLTAAAHEAFAAGDARGWEADEPAEAGDPVADTEPEPEPERGDPSPVSPFAGLPRGTEFGTLVHAAFEELDFAAPDLAAELERVTAHLAPRTSVDLSAAALAAALEPVLRTPLGDIADGRSLAAFTRADRLSELSFDLPLDARDSATLRSIADILAAHLGPDDPLAPYPARLRELDPAGLPLRGVLTGSIDAVLRLRPENRFVVVDYKTNQLGGPEQRVSEYDPAALAVAMMDSHYPLQAVFYCVALHRYLRWRLRGYDPATHLGGVGYLFVRGMAGPASDGTTTPGVFAWRPPAAMITALSDALAGAAVPNPHRRPT